MRLSHWKMRPSEDESGSRPTARRIPPVTVEVDVGNHEDAVALMQRLGPYRPDLVESTSKRWQVRAEAPGRQGESIPRALATIEEGLAERHVDAAAVRVNGQLYSAPGRSGMQTQTRPYVSSPRGSARRPSPRARRGNPLPHRPIELSRDELNSLAPTSESYDDVNRGDPAEFVQFVEGDGRVKAITTFTHVVDKSRGTISVLQEHEDGGKTTIGTRELAFRKNRLVYDPANPDGPDLGFLTGVSESARG